MHLTIEIIRELAALWVFAYHISNHFAHNPFLYETALLGHHGVPIFFVLSGFVIAYSAESTIQNNGSPLAFLKRRFLRIYPPLWASIAVVLVLPYLLEFISFFKTGSLIIPTIALIQTGIVDWLKTISLMKVFDATSDTLSIPFSHINSVYWSLAIEMQIYAVVAIAISVGKFYKHILIVITAICIALPAIPYSFNHRFFVHYWYMFAIGVAFAYLYKNNLTMIDFIPAPYIKHELVISILLAASAVTIPFTLAKAFGSISALEISITTAALIWVLAPVERLLTQIKTNRSVFWLVLVGPLLTLGTISYSVYLLHGKLFQVPETLVRQVLAPNHWSYPLSIITLTLLMCWPFYYLIGRPFTNSRATKNNSSISQQ